MAVEWEQVRGRLLAVVEALKQRKAVDLGVRELLRLIPVVGGFVAAYWDELDAPGQGDADQIAAFLAQLADDRALFERAERRLDAIGDSVLQLHEPLAQILGDLEGIRDDTGHIREVLQRIEEAVRTEPARRGLAFGLALLDDRERAARTLAEVKRALEESGQAPTPAALYLLGMAAAGRADHARAEAALLAAVADPSLAGIAHRGLAITYQRWANEQIAAENYGSAADLLTKAAAHGTQAATHDQLDPLTLTQLGYTEKELAQRLQHLNRPAAAEPHLDEALRYFTAVLKLDPDDPSAHNGLAGVALLRGDHDRAIAAAEAAVALRPDYREALFDLSQAYLLKARTEPGDHAAVARGLEVARSLLELEDADRSLPDHALQLLRGTYGALDDRRRAATPARATVVVGAFTYTGAATDDRVAALSGALEPYDAHLRGLLPALEQRRPEIHIDSEASSRARVSYPDRARGRVVVGLRLVDRPDAVLHEYTHYLLEGLAAAPRASWPASVRAVEAGLASYLPSSHRDDPFHGMFDLRRSDRVPPPWLDDAHRDGLAWAGALWAVRAEAGPDVLDALLLQSWGRVSAAPDQAAVVAALAEALTGVELTTPLTEALAAHGLDPL